LIGRYRTIRRFHQLVKLNSRLAAGEWALMLEQSEAVGIGKKAILSMALRRCKQTRSLVEARLLEIVVHGMNS